MNIIALSLSNSGLLGALLFVFGLIVGSFLNVVAIRYKEGGRLFDFRVIGGLSSAGIAGGKRSHCPRCGRLLGWWELIPLVSCIVQLGRCRGCKQKISWQYPAVELLTGLAFLAPVYFWHYYFFSYSAYLWPLVIAWLLVALAMILLSAIDSRIYIIPDQIVVFLAVLGVLITLFNPNSFLTSYGGWINERLNELVGWPVFSNAVFNHLWGAAFGLLLLGLIVFLSRGRAMGMGDVKLGGAMGLILGWPDIFLALAFGFLLGGGWSFLLLLCRRARLKTMVPFGPFLVIGFWLLVFFGNSLVNWYTTIV